jgi:hypothetical protein
LRDRQELDAEELRGLRSEWAGASEISMFRCDVGARGDISFAELSGQSVRGIA